MRRVLSLVIVLSSFAFIGSVSPASADDTRLYATMTGSAERPGPGDPDGIGRAVVTVNTTSKQVCVVMQFTNVTLPATGFHIHLAPVGSPGPVVVAFSAPTAYQSYQCVSVENNALLQNLVANPGQYYINLHTTPDYAAGAIRGQLQAG